MLIEKLKEQSCCVLGLGVEGLSTLRFLLAHGCHELAVADQSSLANLPAAVQELLAQHPTIKQHLGPNYLQAVPNYFKIVKGAGISPFQPELIALENDSRYFITSNTELFLDWSTSQPNLVTIGVTGTKGKSTTSSLLHHVLTMNALPSVLGGNVGVPCLELIAPLNLLPKTSSRYVVLELSSHQTRKLRNSPQIVILQAITPEHLDYYPSLEAYYQAKADIVTHQSTAHQVIARWDNPESRKIAMQSKATKTWFGIEKQTSADSTMLSAWIEGDTLKVADESVISMTDSPLVGIHNAINSLPACIVGRQLGLSTSQIRQAILSFSPLAHRLEKITEHNGITFINDSAGTTPEAAAAALESFSSHNIILLAGGSDKQVDLSPLITAIATQQVTELLLFPTTNEKIVALLHKNYPNLPLLTKHVHHVTSMPEAFTIIEKVMKPGDVVLLSPGCASFGVFANYKDRGEQFRTAALAITT